MEKTLVMFGSLQPGTNCPKDRCQSAVWDLEATDGEVLVELKIDLGHFQILSALAFFLLSAAFSAELLSFHKPFSLYSLFLQLCDALTTNIHNFS